MSDFPRIPRSKLDAFDTREEVSLRKLAQTAFDSVALENIVDVDIVSPDQDDALLYNITLDLWENHPLKTINGTSLKGPGNIVVSGGGGSGTVESVALSAPSQFSVSGSPITTTGTLALSWNNQVANRVLAGPTTGADAAPTFRALVADDIPGLPVDQIRNFTTERLLGWGEVVSGDGNGALISTGTGFVWSGDSLNLSTNLQGWHALAPSSKQDTLTPGQGINITANTISVDATAAEIPYDNVVSGLTATDVQAAIDELETMVGGGGGLTHFTESVNTSAPNATVPVVQLLATNAATNVDAAFTTKGTGSILAQIPDNTAAGGNKRGIRATDFQRQRSLATHVASGQESFIGSGINNTSSGSQSCVVSGNGNTAGGTQAGVLCGASNSASGGPSAVVTGSSNSASGARSIVGGGLANGATAENSGVLCGISNQATGVRAGVLCGESNTASGESSWVPGGVNAQTRGLFAAYAWSSARRASQGDNQCIGMPVQGTTSNDTPTILTANRAAASTTNVFVLPNNSCWTGTVDITGRSSAGDVCNFRLRIVGTRGANAASTAVADTQLLDHSFVAAGLGGVAVAVVANTTRGSLEVEVTGLAATTIDWFAHFIAGNQIVR